MEVNDKILISTVLNTSEKSYPIFFEVSVAVSEINVVGLLGKKKSFRIMQRHLILFYFG